MTSAKWKGLPLWAETLFDRIPPLPAPVIFRVEFSPLIEALDVSRAVRAGLHLWNDDTERSHLLAQQEELADSNYWHALLHRREGDYDNAEYWYSRVGEHPVRMAMSERFPGWSSRGFANACREQRPLVAGGPSLEIMQAEEMRSLLRHCL